MIEIFLYIVIGIIIGAFALYAYSIYRINKKIYEVITTPVTESPMTEILLDKVDGFVRAYDYNTSKYIDQSVSLEQLLDAISTKGDVIVYTDHQELKREMMAKLSKES